MLGYFLFAIAFLRTHGFIFDDVEKKGEIVSSSPNVVVNEILELNCTVKQDSGINVSTLHWEVPGNESDKDITQVNEQTLQFRRNISSIHEEGMYHCKALNGYSTEIIDTAHIKIEYEAVRNVTNTTCMLNIQRSEFTCYWELGEYHHPRTLMINASVSMDNNEQNMIPCPQKLINDQTDRISRVQCTWTPADGEIRSAIKIVVLDIVNQLFVVPSRRFSKKYQTRTITKYEPVEYIHVTNQTQTGCTCVNVTWEVKRGLLEISTRLTLDSEWTTDSTVIEIVQNTSHLVCQLVPASNYTVHVQVRPREGLFYSDAKSESFLTCSTAPIVKVPIFRSGYSSSRCYDSQYRDITVYWKKIPRKYQNGELTKYTLSSGGTRREVNATSSLAELQLPCLGDINISISACNAEGCSPRSIMTIPHQNVVFAPKTLIVEKINTSAIELTWFGVDDQNEVDVVWCETKSATFTCKDDISVLNVKTRDSHIVLQQSALNRKMIDVIFGVAVLDDKNKSSGIRWQDPCKYSKDLEPKRISDLTLLADPPENSLIVSWTPVPCDSNTEKNAYIHSYKIIYCKLDSNSNCKGEESFSEILASDITQHILRNLDTDYDYGIWVQALTLSRKVSRSAMLIGTPTNRDLSSDALIGIIVASLFVLILVLAGVVFIVRNVKRKLGLNETFPIHIPKMDFKDVNSNGNDVTTVEGYVCLSRGSINDSSEYGRLYHTTQEDSSYLKDFKPDSGCPINMTRITNTMDIKSDKNTQASKTEINLTLDESASERGMRQQKADIPPKEQLPPGYTRATPVVTNHTGIVMTTDDNNTATFNENSILKSGQNNCNFAVQPKRDMSENEENSVGLSSSASEEHTFQDWGYVSNGTSLRNSSSNGELTVTPPLAANVRLPAGECYYDIDRGTVKNILESAINSQNKQLEPWQKATDVLSITDNLSDTVPMNSDYVPCKALVGNDSDTFRTSKDHESTLQNAINNNHVDDNFDSNINHEGYVPYSGALTFPVN